MPDHDGNFADRPVLFHIRAVKRERLIGDGKADRLFLSRQEKDLLKRFQFPDRPHALCDGKQSLTPEQFDHLAKAVRGILPFAAKEMTWE